MSISQTVDFDDVRKLKIVTLKDKFGSEMKVQLPLLNVSVDSDAELRAAITLMETNEAAWELARSKQCFAI